MDYRINRKNRRQDKRSRLRYVIIAAAGEEEAVATIRHAFDGSVNYFDLATAHRDTFRFFGKTLADVRNKKF